jgi:hypothetical protein
LGTEAVTFLIDVELNMKPDVADPVGQVRDAVSDIPGIELAREPSMGFTVNGARVVSVRVSTAWRRPEQVVDMLSDRLPCDAGDAGYVIGAA